MGDLTEFETTKMRHFVGSLRRTRVMAWMRASPEADRRKAPRLAEACKHWTVAYQKGGKALPPSHVYPPRVRQPCVWSSPQRRTPFVVMLSW